MESAAAHAQQPYVGVIGPGGENISADLVVRARVVSQVGFRGESPLWTFTLVPEGDGTLLTVQGEWHSKVPRVGSRIESMMAREHQEGLQEVLDRVKAKVEAVRD